VRNTLSVVDNKNLKNAVTALDANRFEVEIVGIPLRLKSSHSEETVQQLVKLVNDKIQQSLNSTKSDSLQTAMLLACLNIAEEFLMFKRKALNDLSNVESHALEIVSNLESAQTPQGGLDL
jgi:cell division protein ZapA